MKVIIAGSRHITDRPALDEALRRCPFEITEVVSGGARGVDRMGEEYGRQRKIPIHIIPARWDDYGKRAGPMRNREMARYADALLALWDGSSAGTRSMLNEAHKAGLPIYLHRTDDSPDWTNTEK